MKFSYPDGATPIEDISDLKLVWVKTQNDLNRVEGENIQLAINKYLVKSVDLPTKWFDIFELKKIHHDMFCEVWDWAGKFRHTQTVPGVRPYEISESLKKLHDDVIFWCTNTCDLTRLEQAARILPPTCFYPSLS